MHRPLPSPAGRTTTSTIGHNETLGNSGFTCSSSLSFRSTNSHYNSPPKALTASVTPLRSPFRHTDVASAYTNTSLRQDIMPRRGQNPIHPIPGAIQRGQPVLGSFTLDQQRLFPVTNTFVLCLPRVVPFRQLCISSNQYSSQSSRKCDSMAASHCSSMSRPRFASS